MVGDHQCDESFGRFLMVWVRDRGKTERKAVQPEYLSLKFGRKIVRTPFSDLALLVMEHFGGW